MNDEDECCRTEPLARKGALIGRPPADETVESDQPAGPAVIGFIAGAGSLVWGMGAVAASAVLVSLCATQTRWPSLAGTKPDPSVLM
ncbi:hypothetical protein ACFRQM_44730 [Streptomyces sp. NPDC056831]|uniref:hypothetical protein n=1 Tax=Streptomyces sp. NPDC056831 TaxID=3345954 RepID=UPI0036902FB3